jgi:predicted RND superfamily exporter protein
MTGRDRLPAVLTGIMITSLSFLPGLLYFRFYSLMKAFLREDGEENLEKAFSSLKWFYFLSAVITVFIIFFWILVLNPGQSEMDYE